MKLELLLRTELKTIVNNHRINFVRIITANKPDMIVLNNYIINRPDSLIRNMNILYHIEYFLYLII